ncbi:hypothetical protein J5N97_014637 [Dioscorea zingiberensis]|uniref:Late embryogenesis abundant protein LEA-2 subgroup domain-containing protein n=1 Tax=Dioscorea zingiberensis TaxID=325984 RepID=A0A9D5CVJ6_9LILI|nr:hypothetical protein J5N97_014637 [Dioscorea zingiberensis]
MDPDLKPEYQRRQRRRRRCVLASVAALIALGLLILILALTVFRVRSATTTVNAVHLSGLHAGFNPLTLSVDLNVTLDLDITATNPNHASFKYDHGSAELYYREILAGEADIPPGEVAAEGSVHTHVVLTMLAGRLITNSALYADVASGLVLMKTHTMIPGKVSVAGIIKLHMVLFTSCDVIIDVFTQAVNNTNCSFKTKF